METKFQASFIPKKPVQTGAMRSSGDVNVLLVLSILIFIITTTAAGGVFLYKTTLEKERQQKDDDLVSAQKSFGLDEITQLKARSKQLAAAKAVLEGHVALSPLFSLIEQNTLKSVRFNTFNFTDKDGRSLISLSGEARGFNAVAYQSQVFTALKEFSRPVFSGFVLEDTGKVSFKFDAEINHELLVYANSLNGASETSLNTSDNSSDTNFDNSNN